MESVMRIAICDDNADDIRLTERMTREILTQNAIPHEIVCLQSPDALLSDIRQGISYSILLLDVLMSPMNGIELAAAIRQSDIECAIVFISHSREMALQGYEVGAARYLAKPLSYEKLQEALLYCVRARQNRKEILVTAKTGIHRIFCSRIQCVEAYSRGTRLHLEDGILETMQKFSDFEGLLPRSQFVKCHRSYLVNLASVRRIRPYEFELISGVIVPISKHRYAEINKLFIGYAAN